MPALSANPPPILFLLPNSRSFLTAAMTAKCSKVYVASFPYGLPVQSLFTGKAYIRSSPTVNHTPINLPSCSPLFSRTLPPHPCQSRSSSTSISSNMPKPSQTLPSWQSTPFKRRSPLQTHSCAPWPCASCPASACPSYRKLSVSALRRDVQT